MVKKIIIFGGGISGLTVAHELLDKGFTVSLFEKDEILGGMARSNIEDDNIPSEHSWRGYAPFYKNFFDISKRIPLNTSVDSVFDNLSDSIRFLLPHDTIDKSNKLNIEPQPSIQDTIITMYYVMKCLFSDKRRQQYSQVAFKDVVGNKLTKNGWDNYISMIGPGLGLDIDTASLYHISKFVEMSFFEDTGHVHKSSKHHSSEMNQDYLHTKGWHVMNNTTNKAFIDPWVNHLENKGLNIYRRTQLIKINRAQDHITSCTVINSSGDIHTISADEYVMCVNPYNLSKIFIESGLSSPKLIQLTKNKPHNQISFRIGFNKIIKYPYSNNAFAFPDSEFNITLYPQELFWKEIPENIKSLWSGTACITYNKGQLYGKDAISLNKAEFMQEIIYQIFRSEELKIIIEKYNSFTLEDLRISINHIEIWHEWKYDNSTKKMVSDNSKWVNGLNTYMIRPSQKTDIDNLYLGGAHTKTSVDIWSMEGSVESGKIVSNHILDKYNLEKTYKYTHMSSLLFRIIQMIDNILYVLYLPNILDLFIITCSLIIIKLFSYYIK